MDNCSKKEKQNRKIVIGNSAEKATFKGVMKKSVVCVSRLALGTSTDTIVEYLKAIDVDVISCYLVSSKSDSKFVTVRLCVSHANANKLFNSDI